MAYLRGKECSDEMMQPLETPKRKRELWEWGKALVIAGLIALIIRTFLFAPYIVDGHSMDTTLHDHERLFVDKAIYLIEKPARGDIIVFHATPTKDFVKRVIGLPGDMVQVRHDSLYINGKIIPEPYLAENKKDLEGTGMPLTMDFGPVRVPAGKIFVMGDNRQNSLDSRFQLGPVNLDEVVGRAEFVFWPIEGLRSTHS
jgi:signal peptidase I